MAEVVIQMKGRRSQPEEDYQSGLVTLAGMEFDCVLSIVHGGSTFYEVMKVLINSWNENVMKAVHVSGFSSCYSSSEEQLIIVTNNTSECVSPKTFYAYIMG